MYVGHKQRACKEVGIASELIRLPEDVSNHTVENCLEGMVSIFKILTVALFIGTFKSENGTTVKSAKSKNDQIIESYFNDEIVTRN